MPLSKFKNLEGVRNDVVNSISKAKGASRLAKQKTCKDKPPLKVSITKKGSLKGRNNVSKPMLKQGLKKAISMNAKNKKAVPKLSSKNSLQPKLTKNNTPIMHKVNSSQSQVSTSASTSIRARVGRSADTRKANLDKKKKSSIAKSVSRV